MTTTTMTTRSSLPGTVLRLALLLALGAGCTGVLGDPLGGGGGDGDGGNGGDGGSATVDGGSGGDGAVDDPLIGAGGRDLTTYWGTVDVPYGDNVKVVTFDMLRNEVLRATGKSWVVAAVDQWDLNRSVLGGADYVTSFNEDRTVSQQKIVSIRKMAFAVCGDVVAEEAGQATRTVFAVVDPARTIAPADAAVADQVRALYKRFFLLDAEALEIADALTLLTDVQAQATPREAWRGLCSAYLSSMRFLTY